MPKRRSIPLNCGPVWISLINKAYAKFIHPNTWKVWRKTPVKTINTFQNPSTKMQKLTLCIPRNKASSTIWSGPPKSVSSDSPQLFEYIAISSILCTRDWASISEVVAPLLFLIPYKKKSIKIPKGNQCVLLCFQLYFYLEIQFSFKVFLSYKEFILKM